MRSILNTLTTILENFGSREVPSGPESAHPSISTHRNPPAAARSRSARPHAAKSATRLHRHRSTANGVSDNKKHTSAAGTRPAHGAHPRGTKYQQGNMRRLAGGKPLQRCNTALVPQPVHPQPPGAFVTQPSFVVPGRPELDDQNLPPLYALKLFSDAKVKGDQALLRASEERDERAMDPEYARQLEEAHAARRRVEEGVQTRMDAAERLKARQEEARREATENFRKYCEARRRAVEQERQRQAELEATERARREQQRRFQERLEQQRRFQERLEQQRRFQERLEQQRLEEQRLEQQRRLQEQLERRRLEEQQLEQERREREATELNRATQVRQYEDRWTQLRGNTAGAGLLKVNDIPWPWFDYVQCLDDITDERVMEFVRHPLQRHMGPDGGLAKARRFEMLRWHPDQFNGKVLSKVVGEDQEIVREAAARIVRVLTNVD